MSFDKTHINSAGCFNTAQKSALIKSFNEIESELTPQTAFTALTDSTGGVASNTIAAITAGASYAQADLTAIKNAIASIAADINSIRTKLIAAGVFA